MVKEAESGGNFDPSQSDLRVLLGLMRYPGLPVSGAAERSGIPVSTFSSVTRRLEENRCFHRLLLPSIWDMGGDVVSFDLVRSPELGNENWPGSGILSGHRYQVMQNCDQDTMISVSVSPRYEDLLKWRSRFLRKLHGSKLPHSHDFMEFPCEGLEFFSFFDFTSVIEGQLGPEGSGESIGNHISGATPEVEMNRTFHLILKSMMTRPDLNNRELAEYLGLSRQTVNRFVRLAKEKGLLNPVVIPDMGVLGYDIMGVFFLDLKDEIHHIDPEDLEDADRALRCKRFFNVYSTGRQVIFTVHRDYDDFRRTSRVVTGIYHTMGIRGVTPIVSPVVLGPGGRSPLFYLDRMADML